MLAQPYALSPTDGQKPLKTHFYKSCRLWLGRHDTRYQFGKRLSASWGKAATVQNGSSAGFKPTAIPPFNSDVSDYAFCTGETSPTQIAYTSSQKQNSL